MSYKIPQKIFFFISNAEKKYTVYIYIERVKNCGVSNSLWKKIKMKI